MIDFLKGLFDIILHIDIHLQLWVTEYQAWTYLILFAIIFMETGLVVTPFLPGDSLLFAAGTIAAMPGEPLSLLPLILLLICAAFSGDNTNYFIGRILGKTVYERNYRLIRREYLDRTHAFYEKHGGKTLIIARFMPIIRTFAPFVAGVGTMRYIRFISFSLAGYFFGNIPMVRRNFTLAILMIIFVSVLPMIIAVVKRTRAKKDN